MDKCAVVVTFLGDFLPLGVNVKMSSGAINYLGGLAQQFEVIRSRRKAESQCSGL